MSTVVATNLSDGVTTQDFGPQSQLAVQHVFDYDQVLDAFGPMQLNISSGTDDSTGHYTTNNTAAFTGADERMDKVTSLTSSYSSVFVSSPTAATRTASARQWSTRNSAGTNVDYDYSRGCTTGELA